MKWRHLLMIVFALSFTICTAQDAKDIEKQKSKLILFPEEKLNTEMYRNHIGQVCFSNEEFERTLPESKYIKTHNFGNRLNMRAFMANSPANSMLLQLVESGKKAKEINDNRNSFSYQTKVLFVLYFDGQRIANTSYAQSFTESDMTSLPTHRAELVEPTGNYFGEELYKALKGKVELLTPGKHKIKIELVPFKTAGYGSDFDYKPIASGELEVVINNTKIDLNDPEVCMPVAKMTDKVLEAKILKAFKAKGFKGEPKKVRITSTKWNIRRNEFGIILRRSVEAYVGFTEGGVCKYDVYDFNQDYDGSAYQDEVYLMGEGIGTERQISCQCLK